MKRKQLYLLPVVGYLLFSGVQAGADTQVINTAIKEYDVCVQDTNKRMLQTNSEEFLRAEKRCEHIFHRIRNLSPIVSKRLRDRVKRRTMTSAAS